MLRIANVADLYPEERTDPSPLGTPEGMLPPHSSLALPASLRLMYSFSLEHAPQSDSPFTDHRTH